MKAKSIIKAFTLLELLIGMAIFSVLLAAIAVAMESSVNSCTINKDIYTSLNRARQTMARITYDLRNAQGVSTDSLTNECSLITQTGSDITYKWDSQTSKLWLITNDDLTDEDYLLCENVTALKFEKQIINKDGTDRVKYVKISIEVTGKGKPQKLSTAVVLRKNL